MKAESHAAVMEATSAELSADAAEFVPTTQDPSSLPKYMFNCYPFVTTETANNNNKKTAGSAGGKSTTNQPGTAHTTHGQRIPASQQHPGSAGRKGHGAIAANSSLYPTMSPAHFYSQISTRPPGGMYGQSAQHNVYPTGYYPIPRCASPATVALHGGYNRQPAPRMPYNNNNYGPAQHTPHAPRARPSRPHTSTTARQHSAQSSDTHSGWQGGTPHRKHQKQGSTSSRPKISVGTQNEFNSKHTNKPTGNCRSVTRTIILVDTAAQTDFSSEIADHTLEQVPNALYQGKRKLRRKTVPSRQQNGADDDETTESEELDHSDSGYSSPMHRQNQISSGTDARTKVLGTSYERAQQPAVTVSPQSSSVRHQHIVVGHGMTYASALTSQHVVLPTPTVPTQERTQQPHPHNSIAQQNDGAISEEGADDPASTKKKKRKRGRRRKRKDKVVAADDNNPGSCTADTRPYSASTIHENSHSPILSQETTFDLLAPDRITENFPTFAEAALYDDSAECKLSGKRKKRREQANKAAIEEQLEIDLEQQALKVVNQTPVIVKPATTVAAATVAAATVAAATAPPVTGKKSQQPVSINIMDMINTANPKKVQPDSDSHPPSLKKNNNSFSPKTSLNPLDSTAPTIKRGKEREIPKAKKPSALKKVILKEREERKRLRYIGDGPVDLISTPDSSLHFTSEPEENDEDDVMSDMEEHNSLANSLGDDSGTPHSQDLSPVSQNSPISVGLLSPPASLSNPASGVGSPTVVNDIIQKIHSRRFREYCKQVLDKDIDVNCTNLLQTLVKFQDRLYHKDPMKAKTKRRLVLGLREVTKHLKIRRVKLVIISPNLEKIQSKGGLDDALNMIINLCREQDVPFVFALGRRSLGRACAKLVPVSVVGVFNYQGAEAMYNELIELTSQAREAYHEMVDALAKELAEYGGALKGSCGLYFSHLGHSRTPSGCSAISFTSSILSEPVSDIPSSKPDHAMAYNKPTNVNSELASSQSSIPTSASSSVNESRVPLQDDIYDIDEGNEADTEDNDAVNHGPLIQPTAPVAAEELGSQYVPVVSSAGDMKLCINNNERNAESSPQQSQDTVPVESTDTISHKLAQLSLKKRPSHDSHRHSRSNSGSHIEIRSQTSSRTMDQHDTVSTHSSVTIENASETEPLADPLGSSSSSCRIERIKSWVRDVDSTPTTEISQDDAEFNATYTACEANTDVLISRSRSPSVSKT